MSAEKRTRSSRYTRYGFVFYDADMVSHRSRELGLLGDYWPSHRAKNVSRWLQAAHEHRGERPGIAGVRTVSGLTQQPLHWPGVSSVIDIPDEQPWHRVRQPCGIAKRRHDANGVTGLVMGDR
jgi:hypothetical protein